MQNYIKCNHPAASKYNLHVVSNFIMTKLSDMTSNAFIMYPAMYHILIKICMITVFHKLSIMIALPLFDALHISVPITKRWNHFLLTDVVVHRIISIIVWMQLQFSSTSLHQLLTSMNDDKTNTSGYIASGWDQSFIKTKCHERKRLYQSIVPSKIVTTTLVLTWMHQNRNVWYIALKFWKKYKKKLLFFFLSVNCLTLKLLSFSFDLATKTVYIFYWQCTNKPLAQSKWW